MVDLIEEGLSVTTVNRKMATLRSYYKFLLKSQIINTDPTGKIQSLKKGKIAEFIQEKAIEKILSEANFHASFEGQRDRMVMEILYLTGMRLSELIALNGRILTWKMQLKVLGKGKKYRIIPISNGLQKNIIFYQKEFEETFSNIHQNDYFIVRLNRKTQLIL
jgi:integrase/recombinase XerC